MWRMRLQSKRDNSKIKKNKNIINTPVFKGSNSQDFFFDQSTEHTNGKHSNARHLMQC